MNNSFTLHLLRHGAPETPGLMLGHQDMPASREGAAACAAKARNLCFQRLHSSDLARCAASARSIAAARHLPVPLALDRRWRELDFGAWEGRAPATLPPEALRQFWADPDAFRPPDGEPWSALATRISCALADLEPTPTLVITHGGAMRAALHLLLGWRQDQCWSLDLPYACVLTLRLWRETGEIGWRGQILALQP